VLQEFSHPENRKREGQPPTEKVITRSRCDRECFTGRKEMPKLKTKRGAAKRFKKTGSGKIVRSKAFGNHILTKKTTKRKRSIRKSEVIKSANLKSISRLIPYV
jgi:large subunit ribosomal protein L35